jgi:hypothetical protein
VTPQFGASLADDSRVVIYDRNMFIVRPQGARKLMGENLKLVWAEFSALSWAVLMMSIYLFTWMHAHIYR